MDLYDLQYPNTNYTHVISSIVHHCNMQMSSTRTKQSLKWNDDTTQALESLVLVNVPATRHRLIFCELEKSLAEYEQED